jgi:hypothetical protein
LSIRVEHSTSFGRAMQAADDGHRRPDALPYAAAALAVAAAVLGLTWFQTVHPPDALTRDALAVASKRASTGARCCSPFLGAVSTVGIILWGAGAAIAITASSVLRLAGADRRGAALLLTAGLLSAWLALDDGFMLHETYEVRVLGPVSVLQLVPLLGGIAVATVFAWARSPRGAAVFGLAATALGTSAAIDAFIRQTAAVVFVEDAFKFLGICLWTAFLMFKSTELTLQATGGPARADHRARAASGPPNDRAHPDRSAA